MMRRRRLVVGTVVAGLAVAALAAPALAARNSNNAGNILRPERLSAACSYPPASAPAVSLSSSIAQAQRRVKFSLLGSVSVNGCGLKKRGVGLYSSTSASGPFELIAYDSTNNNGVFSFSTKQTQTMYYKAASAAGRGFSSAESGVVTVSTT